MSKIVDFYLGGQDNKGRSIDEILSWSDAKIEAVHDFIQWVFPLHEKSLHSINTPILSKEDIDILSNSDIAKANMSSCLDRFSDFLGLNDNDQKKINFWANEGNHNLLRITRIIRSLRLFGLEMEAYEFYNKVITIGKDNSLPIVTMQFWTNALVGDISGSLTEKFLELKAV